MRTMLVLKSRGKLLERHYFKTICQPRYVKELGIHEHIYLPKALLGKRNPKGKTDADPRGIDVVRIQHYWTRAEDYYRAYKVPRIKRNPEWKYTPEKAEAKCREINSEIDTTTLRFVPELRKRLGFECEGCLDVL